MASILSRPQCVKKWYTGLAFTKIPTRKALGKGYKRLETFHVSSPIWCCFFRSVMTKFFNFTKMGLEATTALSANPGYEIWIPEWHIFMLRKIKWALQVLMNLYPIDRKMGCTNMPGLGTMLICFTCVLSFITFILHAISFSMPNWLESVNPSPFIKIGWHRACFDSCRYPYCPGGDMFIYDGCWWIYDYYFKEVKDWLRTGRDSLSSDTCMHDLNSLAPRRLQFNFR